MRIIKNQSGFQLSFKKRDSTTGLKALRTGVSQEADTGVTPSLSGSLRTMKKLFALDLLLNLRLYQVMKVLLRTYTENSLMISLFLQSKERVF